MTATTLACVHFHGISTDAMNHAMEVWNILGGWDYYDLPYFRSVNYYNLPRSTTLSLYIYVLYDYIFQMIFQLYPMSLIVFCCPPFSTVRPRCPRAFCWIGAVPRFSHDLPMIIPCPIPFCWITNGTLGGYHGNILRM